MVAFRTLHRIPSLSYFGIYVVSISPFYILILIIQRTKSPVISGKNKTHSRINQKRNIGFLVKLFLSNKERKNDSVLEKQDQHSKANCQVSPGPLNNQVIIKSISIIHSAQISKGYCAELLKLLLTLIFYYSRNDLAFH